MRLTYDMASTSSGGAAEHHQIEEGRTLYLQNLRCDAQVGAYPSERGRTQKIVVNVVLGVGRPEEPVRDDLQNVLDYSQIRQGVLEIVGSAHFNLQETLCEAIMTFCFSLGQVRSAHVRVGKLEAFQDCEAVGCELWRTRRAS